MGQARSLPPRARQRHWRFAAAMKAASAMDRPISDGAADLGRDMERYLKGFIRDMVRICRYSLGRKMSGMVYALFRRKKWLTFSRN